MTEPQTEAGKALMRFMGWGPAWAKKVRRIELEATGDRDRREAALAKALQLLGEWIGGPLADWIEQTPGTETMPLPPVTVLDFMAAPGQAGPPESGDGG